MARGLIWIFLSIGLLIYILQITSREIYSRGRLIYDTMFWISVLAMFLSYFWYKKSKK